ncbi:MAG: DivIVA domain-containing protein [Candidatus Latescibacterota bacterium]
MNITASDIRKQEFRKTLRGFDAEEVQVFLESVADAFESSSKENAAFRERVRGLEDSLGHYTQLEKTLQDTLVTAQQVTDSTRQNARKEADLIIREARVAADEEIEIARRKLVQIKREIIDLSNYRDTLIARIRAMCRSHMELLQAFEREQDEAPILLEGLDLIAGDGRIDDEAQAGQTANGET